MRQLLLVLLTILLPASAYASSNLYVNSSNGNVGIGTTSPSNILSIDGTAAQTVWMERGTTAGNNLTIQAGGGLSGGTNENGGNLILSSGIATGSGSSDIQFKIYEGGGSGTSDTSALTALTLSVVGSGSTINTVLQGISTAGTNQNGGTLILESGASTGTGTSEIDFNVYTQGSSGSTANSPIAPLVVTGVNSTTGCASGCVGIGSATPAFPLDVVGETHMTYSSFPVLEVERTTSNTSTTMTTANVLAHTSGTMADGFGPVLGFQVETSGGVINPLADIGARRHGSDSVGDMVFNTYVSGAETEQMRILNGGTVGIGTTAPRGGSTLDVNGKLYVGTFAAGSSTTVCQNGNVLSSCTSALRFKENVKASELGLKEVLEMKPVTFDVRDHENNWEKHDFGFVAEDMEKINPLFVTYDKDGRINGVRYMQLAAVNTKAIQELQAEIKALKIAVERLTQQKQARR